jgi:hypothetical protein
MHLSADELDEHEHRLSRRVLKALVFQIFVVSVLIK